MGEFKVITNNVSAEYGYRLGAKVIVSTKSGTNRFRGSLYEFYRNGEFDANEIAEPCQCIHCRRSSETAGPAGWGSGISGRCGSGDSVPGLHYAMFPGNVGGKSALVATVNRLPALTLS